MMYFLLLFHPDQLFIKLLLISLIIPGFIFLEKRNFKKWHINSDFNHINFLIGIASTLLALIAIINWEIKPKAQIYSIGDEPIIDTISVIRTVFPVKKKSPPVLVKKEIIKKEEFVIKIDDSQKIEIEKDPIDLKLDVSENSVNVVDDKPAIIEINTEPDIDAPPIFVPDQMPRFPGCEQNDLNEAERIKCAEKNLLSFLYDNLDYPSMALDNEIEGTVVVQFVVTENGDVEKIKIRKDIGGGCGKAAENVVQMMNDLNEKWTPGKQRGRPVKVMYTLPIKFKMR